tara:strand:- start:131 stop:649 length:519 start_codon:yes stop_codon:yes gene_type:complete
MPTRIEPLYGQGTIRNRTRTIADFINEDYENIDNVVLLCVLKGSVNFFSDLSLMLDIEVEYEFIGLSSYEGTESTGNIDLTTKLPDVKGKNVIIVEDIVDTGRTIEYLKTRVCVDANDVKVCTLLDKPSRREVDVEPDYVVFTIDDLFVVGYGLDYNEQWRNLPFIGIYEEW